VRQALVILLLILFGALATMLPLRPAFREIARELSHKRRNAHTHLIAASAIPANAWEADDEFRMDGRLYDVIGASTQDGCKYYRCVADEAELSAEASADNLVRELAVPNPSSQQGKIARALADWLSHLFCEQEIRWQCGDVSEIAAVIFPMGNVPALQQEHLNDVAWPPEA
jgi:hypothetical protein